MARGPKKHHTVGFHRRHVIGIRAEVYEYRLWIGIKTDIHQGWKYFWASRVKNPPHVSSRTIGCFDVPATGVEVNQELY